MGEPREAEPVCPMAGLLAASPLLLAEAREVLAQSFGPLSLWTAPYPWLPVAYYQREMGPRIWRQWISFAGTMHPGELPGRKRAANELERRWCGEGRRRVNIDPGYVDLERVVLASTKSAAHRLWLGEGVWGEVTLRWRRGGFEPWPWTYPDYRWPAARAFFSRIRERLRRDRRRLRRR